VSVCSADQKQARQQHKQSAKNVDDQQEVRRAICEFCLDVLAYVENGGRRVETRVLVRLRSDVELECFPETGHRGARRIDGILDGVACPNRRLADGATIIEAVADCQCTERFTDVHLIRGQADTIYRSEHAIR